MDTDLALLHQKIDALTELANSQQHTLTIMAAQLETQQRRMIEMEELKNDLVPIANQMIRLSINELAEIGNDFQLEDLLFLLKRLLRDTHMLLNMLDTMQGAMELNEELQRMGKQMFNQAVESLDRLERQGYFDFARGGWRIVERIVQEFDQDDIESLGENIVTILHTVRNLTQPEIMGLTNQSLEAIRQPPGENGNISLWDILRGLSDPKVRQGMARLLNLVRVLAEQPSIPKN